MKKKLFAGLLGALLPLPLFAAQQQTATVPAGTQTININVAPATPAAPTVTIDLKGRHFHAYPHRAGCCHTGGGNVLVAQATPDVAVLTMTGICVAAGSPCGPASASMDFDLDQCFEVTFATKDVKAAKVTMEVQVIGLLRSECKTGGFAEENNGCVAIACDTSELLSVCAPPHSVGGGENLSINDHEGPCEAPIAAGKYKLHATFHIAASQPKTWLPCKPASAEFAPDPALDPLWISYWEPFHGIKKDSFGLQITIKVAEDTTPPANGEKKEEEKKDEEKKDDEKKDEKLPSPTPDKGNGKPQVYYQNPGMSPQVIRSVPGGMPRTTTRIVNQQPGTYPGTVSSPQVIQSAPNGSYWPASSQSGSPYYPR